jgi:hypothetical protein
LNLDLGSFLLVKTLAKYSAESTVFQDFWQSIAPEPSQAHKKSLYQSYTWALLSNNDS